MIRLPSPSFGFRSSFGANPNFCASFQSRLKTAPVAFHFYSGLNYNAVHYRPRIFIYLISRPKPFLDFPIMAGDSSRNGGPPKLEYAISFVSRAKFHQFRAAVGDSEVLFAVTTDFGCRLASAFSNPLAGQACASKKFHKKFVERPRGKQTSPLMLLPPSAHLGGTQSTFLFFFFFRATLRLKMYVNLKAIVRFLADQLGERTGPTVPKQARSDSSAFSFCGQVSSFLDFHLFSGLRFADSLFCAQFITSFGTGPGFRLSLRTAKGFIRYFRYPPAI